MYVCMYVCIFS